MLSQVSASRSVFCQNARMSMCTRMLPRLLRPGLTSARVPEIFPGTFICRFNTDKLDSAAIGSLSEEESRQLTLAMMERLKEAEANFRHLKERMQVVEKEIMGFKGGHDSGSSAKRGASDRSASNRADNDSSRRSSSSRSSSSSSQPRRSAPAAKANQEGAASSDSESDDEHDDKSDAGKAVQEAADGAAQTATDTLKEAHPKLVEFVNSGYLESIKRLRDTLMKQEWEMTAKLFAQRKAVSEFEKKVAESDDLDVPYDVITALYEDPDNLSVIEDVKVRSLARGTITSYVHEKELELYRELLKDAKEMANMAEGGGNQGLVGTAVKTAKTLLPIPGLK